MKDCKFLSLFFLTKCSETLVLNFFNFFDDLSCVKISLGIIPQDYGYAVPAEAYYGRQLSRSRKLILFCRK